MAVGIRLSRDSRDFVGSRLLSCTEGTPLWNMHSGTAVSTRYDQFTQVIFTKTRGPSAAELVELDNTSNLSRNFSMRFDVYDADGSNQGVYSQIGYYNYIDPTRTASHDHMLRVISSTGTLIPNNRYTVAVGADGLLLDKWIATFVSYDAVNKAGYLWVLDPADGSIIGSHTFDMSAVDINQDPFNIANLRPTLGGAFYSKFNVFLTSENHTDGSSEATAMWPDWDLAIAEVATWSRAFTLAEAQAYAQVGFAELNAPTDLIHCWDFMRNWKVLAPANIVPDTSGNGNTGTMYTSTYRTTESWQYLLDNPVPVYLARLLSSEHDAMTVALFSATTGTAKMSAYPAGTPQPTEEEIFAGATAVETISVEPDGASEVTGVFTNLVTGTDYVVYSVQGDGQGGYGPVASFVFTTPTKYSEIITDVTGAEVTGQSGIQWAWFDEENPSTLTTAVTQGVAELTDATGLLEITLPTSISTPKGSKGTMVLRADWGGSTQTASHLVEVK